MAFGTAETELFGIVSDKDYAVSRIAWRGAEITLFNAHGEILKCSLLCTVVSSYGSELMRKGKK
jgi:hypothetical protein